MKQSVVIGIIVLCLCCLLSIVAVLVTLYFEDPSFYGITTTTSATSTTKSPDTTTASNNSTGSSLKTFTKKTISAGFNGSATSGNKEYLYWMDHGDGLFWWDYPSSSSVQTFSLDSKGYLTVDDKSGTFCYNNSLDKTNITLSTTLTPIVFTYDPSSGTLTDVNGKVLGKGLNGQGNGSWPFLLTLPIVPPNVIAKVEV